MERRTLSLAFTFVFVFSYSIVIYPTSFIVLSWWNIILNTYQFTLHYIILQINPFMPSPFPVCNPRLL